MSEEIKKSDDTLLFSGLAGAIFGFLGGILLGWLFVLIYCVFQKNSQKRKNCFLWWLLCGLISWMLMYFIWK